MKEYERAQLLARIDRDGATVGSSIPEEVDVQGETLALREFVFETSRRDSIPPGERDRVDRAKRTLRRERNERVERIETGDVTREEAERDVEIVIGIDRALTALESLGSTDLEATQRAAEAADAKRWTSFLQQALGRDSSDRRRHR